MWEDKTKCILFKKGKKEYLVLNIIRNENKIKQYFVVEYLGCLVGENLSGESMAKRALTKLMEKQNLFMGRIGTYHTLKRMLCNSLIQPHLDFACYA